MGRKREGEYPKTIVSLRLSVDVVEGLDSIVEEAKKRGIRGASRSSVADLILRDFLSNGGPSRFLALWDSLHGGMPEEKLPQEEGEVEEVVEGGRA